jgi:hypothetical protein
VLPNRTTRLPLLPAPDDLVDGLRAELLTTGLLKGTS